MHRSPASAGHERLQSYLDAVPFPLPKDIDIDRLAKRFAKDGAARKLLGTKIVVHVLASFLTDYLINHLLLMFARRGLSIEIRQGDYGVLATAILDKSHVLHQNPPDLFLILPCFRDLAFVPNIEANEDEAQTAIDQEVRFWLSLWDHLPAPAVHLSFDPVHMRPLGDLDGFIPGGTTYHARHVNMKLAAQIPPTIAFVDAENLAFCIGRSDWHDPHVYHLCKQPFSFSALPHVADALSASAAGLLGKGRRVLVLDLDNTLWGGIIGDDGLENIELGPETPEGEAFSSFQNYILALRDRGIILAVCSKNTDALARLPFKQHPAMVLKETDMACFVANFEDKPSNLRHIAKNLNMGLESFVFVDDNPVERALMRQELPEVLTLELPENPALYAHTLDSCRAFPLTHFTPDDIQRAQSYAARAKTTKAMSETSNLDGFLKSLSAKAIVEPIGPGSLERVVQLMAKTNQFKLNPSLFNQNDLKAKTQVIALRLTDKIQDYGIVAIAVLARDLAPQKTMEIKNWVMSCRVFSRRLEYVMFLEILRYAKEQAATRIALTYTPNDRNGVVATLLPKLGFEAMGKHDTYHMNINEFPQHDIPDHHMEIIRQT